MARIRTIKPEFYTSETLATVSIYAERTFGGLITQSDDEGRYKDNAAILHGAIYPLRPEHTPADVEDDLTQLEHAGLICRYTADGKRYLHLLTFGVHQKISHPTPSKLPPCPLHHAPPSSGKTPEGSGSAPNDAGKTPDGSDPGSRAPDQAGSDDRLTRGEEIPAQGSLPFDPGESPAQDASGDFPEDSGELPLGSGSGSGSGFKNLRSSEMSGGASKSAKRSPKRSDFDEYWRACSRKVGKIKAEKAFNDAVRNGADPADIIAAARSFTERHRLVGTPKDKIPHPTTWLNRGSWGDDLDDAVPLPGATAAGPPDTTMPPHCGRCDPVDRRLTRPDRSVYPCPDCHPARAGASR